MIPVFILEGGITDYKFSIRISAGSTDRDAEYDDLGAWYVYSEADPSHSVSKMSLKDAFYFPGCILRLLSYVDEAMLTSKGRASSEP